MASNPISIAIPANCQGSISCLSNASYFQRVTLTWPGNTVVFQGTGEGTPITAATGQTAVPLPSTTEKYEIEVAFDSSSSGPNGPFEPAQVNDPVTTQAGAFTIIEVTSEDATDHDNNDSYLIFALVSDEKAPGGGPGERLADRTAAAGKQLELHAKTYYNDPYAPGGDEHYVTVSDFVGAFGSTTYSGTGWQFLDGEAYDRATPLGGYLMIYVKLNNCVHYGLETAVLTLSTTISYWGSRPTGFRSVDWVGSLVGTLYQLTRVTN